MIRRARSATGSWRSPAIGQGYFNHIAGTEIDFPLVNSQIALAA
jgi:hypothetical protein